MSFDALALALGILGVLLSAAGLGATAGFITAVFVCGLVAGALLRRAR